MKRKTYVARYPIVDVLRWEVRRTTLARLLLSMAAQEEGSPDRVVWGKVVLDGADFVVTVVGYDRSAL